ncbi:MAG: hypothetical protein LAO18_23865 [Acidobacteriia bacterium]|nr:hypothetical protein [Terriglobia bacterium]
MNKIVLLIDSDLGFVFWLGRTLAEVGYEAFPAKSVPDAFKLLDELQLPVSLLIVRDSLPGIADLIAELRYLQNDLKVILTVEDVNTEIPRHADAQCLRPDSIDKSSKSGWMQLVQKVLYDKRLTMAAPAQRSR